MVGSLASQVVPVRSGSRVDRSVVTRGREVSGRGSERTISVLAVVSIAGGVLHVRHGGITIVVINQGTISGVGTPKSSEIG